MSQRITYDGLIETNGRPTAIKRIRTAVTLAAAQALTPLSDEELILVPDFGIYRYDPSSTKPESYPAVLMHDTLPGRLIADALEVLSGAASTFQTITSVAEFATISNLISLAWWDDEVRGGWFRYDNAGAAANSDNGISFASAASKLWRRRGVHGELLIDWYGADPTGAVVSLDPVNTSPINRALITAFEVNRNTLVNRRYNCIGGGRYLTDDTIQIPHHTSLVLSTGGGRGNSRIVAAASSNWDDGRPVVELGGVRTEPPYNESDPNTFGNILKGTFVNCDWNAHIGVESLYANEMSGCENVSVQNARKWGFFFMHSGALGSLATIRTYLNLPAWYTTRDDTRVGRAQNFYLKECVAGFQSHLASPGDILDGACGLQIFGGHAAIRGIDGFTVDWGARPGAAQHLAANVADSACVRLDAVAGTVLTRIHVEDTKGFEIGRYRACGSVTLVGTQGHFDTRYNVHIYDTNPSDPDATVNDLITVIGYSVPAFTITAQGSALIGSGVSLSLTQAASNTIPVGAVLLFSGGGELTVTTPLAIGDTVIVGDLAVANIADGETASYANYGIYDERSDAYIKGSIGFYTMAADKYRLTTGNVDRLDGTGRAAAHLRARTEDPANVNASVLVLEGNEYDRMIQSVNRGSINDPAADTAYNHTITRPSTAWLTSTDYKLNAFVTNNGTTYQCILAHTSSASDEPGVGGSWATYWIDQDLGISTVKLASDDTRIRPRDTTREGFAIRVIDELFDRIQVRPNGTIRIGDGTVSPVQVVGGQGGAITNPSGGGTIDSEARTAIIAILDFLRGWGSIST